MIVTRSVTVEDTRRVAMAVLREAQQNRRLALTPGQRRYIVEGLRRR